MFWHPGSYFFVRSPGIGSCFIFCHSFSLSNNVNPNVWTLLVNAHFLCIGLKENCCWRQAVWTNVLSICSWNTNFQLCWYQAWIYLLRISTIPNHNHKMRLLFPIHGHLYLNSLGRKGPGKGLFLFNDMFQTNTKLNVYDKIKLPPHFIQYWLCLFC